MEDSAGNGGCGAGDPDLTRTRHAQTVDLPVWPVDEIYLAAVISDI